VVLRLGLGVPDFLQSLVRVRIGGGRRPGGGQLPFPFTDLAAELLAFGLVHVTQLGELLLGLVVAFLAESSSAVSRLICWPASTFASRASVAWDKVVGAKLGHLHAELLQRR
jgi:hypothetical protein